MRYLFMLPLLFLSIITTAQKEIKIEEASGHIGDSVTICTKIYGGKYLEKSKGSPTFLDAGGSYPNALLRVVISDEVRKQLKHPPEEFYKGKQICISGVIKIYKEKPEIIISKTEQLQEPVKVDVR